MKRISVILIILLGTTVYGQVSRPKNLPMFETKKFHFGYTVGGGSMGFKMSFNENKNAVIDGFKPAILIGVVTDFSLSRYTSLRFLPGISFGQRDIEITNSSLLPRIETVFVELPLLVKYRAVRLNNFAPYIVGGVNARLDLTGGELIRGRVAERLIKFVDFYYELGVGFDSYLQKVRLSTELKFSIGISDVFLPVTNNEYEDYSNTFNSLFSRLVILSFHIE